MTEKNNKHLNTIQSLLNQIGLITDKYEEIERITGEKYNIFSILGKSSDELAHSRFISNLLNPKGSHGQGGMYLRLFIDYMKAKFFRNNESQNKTDSNIKVLNEFLTEAASCKTEVNTGLVDQISEEGGRIDILLESGQNHIIIENKLYATDQLKQLVRYNNFSNHAPIFYLTINGKDASKDSKQNLEEGIHYFRISYEEDILNWIIQCVKESTATPFIRETLRQYVNLIKRLTNQLTSNKMEEDLLKLFTNDNRKNMQLLKLVYKKGFQEEINKITMHFFMNSVRDKINEGDNEFEASYSNKGVDRTLRIKNDNIPDDFVFKIDFTKESRILVISISCENDGNRDYLSSIIKKHNDTGFKFVKKRDCIFVSQVERYSFSLESRSNLMRFYYDNEFKNEHLEKIYESIDQYLKDLKTTFNERFIKS